MEPIAPHVGNSWPLFLKKCYLRFYDPVCKQTVALDKGYDWKSEHASDQTQQVLNNFDTYRKLLTGRRLLKWLIPAFLKRGSTNPSSLT